MKTAFDLVAWVEATALIVIAAVEWLIYRTGFRLGNLPILFIGGAALMWFALHERRKNEVSRKTPHG